MARWSDGSWEYTYRPSTINEHLEKSGYPESNDTKNIHYWIRIGTAVGRKVEQLLKYCKKSYGDTEDMEAETNNSMLQMPVENYNHSTRNS